MRLTEIVERLIALEDRRQSLLRSWLLLADSHGSIDPEAKEAAQRVIGVATEQRALWTLIEGHEGETERRDAAS